MKLWKLILVLGALLASAAILVPKVMRGKSATLEFYEVVDTDADTLLNCVENNKCPRGAKARPGQEDGIHILIKSKPFITEHDIAAAEASVNPTRGTPIVNFRFTENGQKTFCTFTVEHIKQPFAIVLKNELVSVPTIQSPICGDSGYIDVPTLEEANDLASVLNAGARPPKMRVTD